MKLKFNKKKKSEEENYEPKRRNEFELSWKLYSFYSDGEKSILIYAPNNSIAVIEPKKRRNENAQAHWQHNITFLLLLLLSLSSKDSMKFYFAPMAIVYFILFLALVEIFIIFDYAYCIQLKVLIMNVKIK